MLNKNTVIKLLFILFILHIGIKKTSGTEQNNPTVKAIQLFNSEDYIKAEPLFYSLLKKDPDNPMLNYYYAASRTENGYYGKQELDYLHKAGKKVTPDRLIYYLAIQHHANENWQQALKYYNKFKNSIPPDEQKKLNLNKKIQQCFDKINPYFSHIKIIKSTEITGDTILQKKQTHIEENVHKIKDNQNNDTIKSATELTTLHSYQRKLLPDLPGVKSTTPLPTGEQIKFRINNNITYLFSSQFKTKKGGTLFQEGDSLKNTLQKKLKKTDELRIIFQDTQSDKERDNIGKKILELESETYQIKEKINTLFLTAKEIESEFWDNADNITIHNFNIKQNNIIATINKKEKQKKRTNISSTDSLIIILPGSIHEGYTEEQQEMQKNGDDHLIYKIQIGAFSKGVPKYIQRLYKKLSYIRKIDNYTDENGIVVYTTGTLTNIKDATIMQNQVRQEGIEDAFIVPYFNGKRITLKQAKLIEEENDL